MGRLKTFDVDHALHAAMGAFRARGYQGTSISDLEGATGLKPGSLYNCFGSKEALFLAVIDRYNRVVVQGRLARHLKGEAPVREMEALFMSTLDEPGGTRLGCLLTNTAVEFGPGSAAISAKVREGFAILEKAFAAQCRRAKAAGLAAPSLRPERAAFELLHAYQGFLVLVRFGRGRAELARLVDDLVKRIFEGGSND